MTTLFWYNIHNGIDLLLHDFKKQGYIPDAIIGLGRGGLIPATLLSYRLNIKSLFCYTLRSYSDDNKQTNEYITVQEPGIGISDYKDKNVLIIDDLADTGETFIHARKVLQDKYGLQNIKTASICIKANTKHIPDFYIQEYPAEKWLNFPWEINGG
jgi:hypoxanthine phosphoribosyltransferase